jgi:DinB superfamily
MEPVARELLEIVAVMEPLLYQISESDASIKPSPAKWSKKEILGHLTDSAWNNQQKFVRTMLSGGDVSFVGYEQDAWVDIQRYQNRKWAEIVGLWIPSNLHLAHIIQNVDPSRLDHTIAVAGAGPYTLGFIMTDYVEHLKHHLIQIIPNAGLKSSFSMSPYV